jgi:hypothetical protein
VATLCACQDHATHVPAAAPRGCQASTSQIRTTVHNLNSTGTNLRYDSRLRFFG